MNFLPISIIAYIFNGGSILVDKILLKTALPKPITYTFFVNLLQLLVLLLIPFGFNLTFSTATYLAIASGIVGVAAFYAFFSSLRENEASVVGPVVGAFNPLFALILGGLFLNHTLTSSQYTAFFILIFGAAILTSNLWFKKLQFGKKFIWMVAAGFLFALSYVLLREAFLQGTFLNGFIFSRIASGTFVLLFLLFPNLRSQILPQKKNPSESITSNMPSKGTLIFLGAGQAMGALSVTLLTFGVSLASPALVNSLFGVQYLVILGASLILAKNHPHLLDEQLSKSVIFQKILGAGVISLGLYLLAR